MISNLVHEAFDFTQYHLYGVELKVAGVSQTCRDTKAQRSVQGYQREIDYRENPNPFFSRLLALPIACVDVLLESVRPLFLVVESVVFMSLSLLAVLWNAIRLKSPTTAMRMTLLNLHDTLYYSALAPGRVALAPIFLIAQLLKIIADPRDAQSSVHNFGSRKLSPEVLMNYSASLHASKEGIVKRAYNIVEDGLYKNENNYSTRWVAQQNRNNNNNNIRQSTTKIPDGKMNPHPLMSRVLAIPLALSDVILEVVKPLIAAISSLALASFTLAISSLTLALIPFTLPIVLAEDNKLGRAFNYIFYQLDEVVTSLAEAVTNVALSPITLISQLLKIWWDPQHVTPSRVGLYQAVSGDGAQGDERIRFGKNITRVDSLGIDELDWMLDSRDQSPFLRQNYSGHVTFSHHQKDSNDLLKRGLKEDFQYQLTSLVMNQFSNPYNPYSKSNQNWGQY